MKNYFPQKLDALILVNGEKPSSGLLRRFYKISNNFLCADGAYDWETLNKFKVDFVVGDMDSISRTIKEPTKGVRIAEQQSNDLEKCLRFSVENGWKDIVILGAFGFRADHFLTNLTAISRFQNKMNIFLLDTSQMLFFCPKNHEIKLSLPVGSFFSLYPFKESCGPISLDGVQYPLKHEHLGITSRLGTLNKTIKPLVTLECQDNDLAVLIPHLPNINRT